MRNQPGYWLCRMIKLSQAKGKLKYYRLEIEKTKPANVTILKGFIREIMTECLDRSRLPFS
jgi:hypothetical protein